MKIKGKIQTADPTLFSPSPFASRTMKWGFVISLLLPYVAATLPPYKRFVSPLIYGPNVVLGLKWITV